MNSRRIAVIGLLLLLFTLNSSQLTFAEEDPYPGVAAGAEIPGTKIWSEPGVSQSQWEATDTYKTFSCPAGTGRGMGVDLNFTSSNSDDRWFAYCVKTWRPTIDINADANFRAAQDLAIAAATAESQAWNAANPGKQKCVQWGPIVHANGVSTASGGVCANPVEPGPGTTVKTAEAPPVAAKEETPPSNATNPKTTPTETPIAPDENPNLASLGSGVPFTRVLPGQLSTAQCPAGFQAANGIINDIGNGIFTECWPEDAWNAWRLGGTTWESYKSSGGTTNVQAVLDLNAAIAALKEEAKAVAQKAADLTPGIQRCSKWSGYGQSGQECAYTFLAPGEKPLVSKSSETPTKPTPTTPQDKSDNNQKPTQEDSTKGSSTISGSMKPETELTSITVVGTTNQLATLINKVVDTIAEQKSLTKILTKLDALRSSTYSKTQSLPNERSIEETAISITPDICSVDGTKVVSLKPGKCVFSYELVGPSGNSFTVEKEIFFKK
jgi:hypothetical protein